MSHQTLYLVQSTANQTASVLLKLNQIYSSGDAIVLMGDATLNCNAPILSDKRVYLLEHDTDLLIDPLRPEITVLSYAQFADLVLNFTRCITLK